MMMSVVTDVLRVAHEPLDRQLSNLFSLTWFELIQPKPDLRLVAHLYLRAEAIVDANPSRWDCFMNNSEAYGDPCDHERYGDEITALVDHLRELDYRSGKLLNRFNGVCG
jgi:hypothetical protein